MNRFAEFKINVSTGAGASKEQRVKCPECPPHKNPNDNSKDLAVNIDKGTWHCHRCGWSGGLAKSKIDSYSPKKQVFTPKQIDKKHIDAFKSPQKEMLEYFEKRKISSQTLEDNGIAMVHKKLKESYSMFIAFPFFFDEEIVNVKYRSLDKEFLQTTDGQRVFYKIDDIKDYKYCIICEGEIDALSFHEVGFPNVISVPDGGLRQGANIGSKLDFLDNCIDKLSHIDKFILALDSDEAGVGMRDELARRLGKTKCWIIDYPSGCKDANDVLVNLDRHVLSHLVENAQPYPVEGIFTANEFYNNMVDIYNHGYKEGLTLGWQKHDELLKWHKGAFVVITGVPSHGKSNYADCVIVQMAKNHGTRIGVFSPENGEIDYHLHRLMEIYTGKALLPTYGNRMSHKEFEEAMDFIHEHIYFIKPKDENYTLDRIHEAAETLVAGKGIEVVLIDPWNTIEHNFKGQLETEYIGKALDQMKYWGRNVGCTNIVVAHPRKMNKQRKGESPFYEKPTLYDINGSAHWYNKAEVGITVYRQYKSDFSETTHTEIIVNKVKHKHWGKVGIAKFGFNVQCQSFFPMEEE